MSVVKYSKQTDGKNQLTANFKVEEMACKDGGDEIRIDSELIAILQKIRDYVKCSVNINSGYRSPIYNAKVGGSPNSQHIQGKAADISLSGITPLQVAQYAESLGVGGIGYAPAGQGNFVHLDTRVVPCRWEYYNGGKNTKVVGTFGGKPITVKPPTTPITIEPKSLLINGQEKQVRCGLVDGENYVHLRDFVAHMGGLVAYDEKTRQISITK
ncbi:MAG: D-Ala-D-Ala carboxypeptidase family metallohydrolase [Firmicutes bacterium]|nr:D-Ala-D-Ala carboxypeptidase family metallohydrolase [Bacillota bacterium]